MRHSIRLIATTLFAPRATTAVAQHLPGTQLLTQTGDVAKVMVEGIDRWLDRETAESVNHRGQWSKPDFSSAEAYDRSLAPKRERLKKLLGLIEPRAAKVEF